MSNTGCYTSSVDAFTETQKTSSCNEMLNECHTLISEIPNFYLNTQGRNGRINNLYSNGELWYLHSDSNDHHTYSHSPVFTSHDFVRDTP